MYSCTLPAEPASPSPNQSRTPPPHFPKNIAGVRSSRTSTWRHVSRLRSSRWPCLRARGWWSSLISCQYLIRYWMCAFCNHCRRQPRVNVRCSECDCTPEPSLAVCTASSSSSSPAETSTTSASSSDIGDASGGSSESCWLRPHRLLVLPHLSLRLCVAVLFPVRAC